MKINGNPHNHNLPACCLSLLSQIYVTLEVWGKCWWSHSLSRKQLTLWSHLRVTMDRTQRTHFVNQVYFLRMNSSQNSGKFILSWQNISVASIPFGHPLWKEAYPGILSGHINSLHCCELIRMGSHLLLYTLQELIWGVLQWVAYKRIYFELYTNDQYIWHKNNIAQLIFYIRDNLHWNFSSIPQRWSWYSQIFQQEVGLNHVHYWKSVNIRGIPKSTGKIQCSSALPNTKYNCAVLFLCQMYQSFVYPSKYIFS